MLLVVAPSDHSAPCLRPWPPSSSDSVCIHSSFALSISLKPIFFFGWLVVFLPTDLAVALLRLCGHTSVTPVPVWHLPFGHFFLCSLAIASYPAYDVVLPSLPPQWKVEITFFLIYRPFKRLHFAPFCFSSVPCFKLHLFRLFVSLCVVLLLLLMSWISFYSPDPSLPHPSVSPAP